MRIEQGSFVYGGTNAQLCYDPTAEEVGVSIDLHGLTREPAIQMLNTSLLHYNNMLKEFNNKGTLTNHSEISALSLQHKQSKNGDDLQRIKSVLIMYVVGQGLHSVGGVPLLRNIVLRELESTWDTLKVEISSDNAGQVCVKMRNVL